MNIKRIIAVAVSAGLLAWLMADGRWRGLGEVFARLDGLTLGLAAAGFGLSYLLRALRIFDEFRTQAGGRFGSCLRITLIHNAMINVVPFRGGEAAFPLLLRQNFGVPLPRAIASLFWFRLQDAFVVMALAAIVWPGLHPALKAVAVVGVLLMVGYFVKLESYVSLDWSALWPRWAVSRPMLRIGIPAGGEFFLMFLYTAAIYWLIRPFGTAAQAGFGIGMRVMQSTFLPAMAISFAIPAVAGQNFGARRADRVRDTLRQGVILECSVMLVLALACHLAPEAMIGAFTSDPAAAEVGVGFLTIISTNFVAMGFVFACSGLFQAMGNTWPAMASTATRLVTFLVPALWLSRQPGFALKQLWFLSVATVLLQALTSGLLVRRELRRHLARFDTLASEGTVGAPAADRV